MRKSTTDLEVKNPLKAAQSAFLSRSQGILPMRKAACWLLSVLLCASLSGEEIIVASYNVQNYWLLDSAIEHPLIDEQQPQQAIAAVIKVLIE